MQLENNHSKDFTILKEQLLFLETIDFNINNLRKFLLFFNNIGSYSYENKITREQYIYLHETAKNMIKERLQELNQTLSEDSLDKICDSFIRGIVCSPKAIKVINNKVVFSLEDRLDDFGQFDRQAILHLSNGAKDDYKEVNDANLEFTQNHWYAEHFFYQPDYKKAFSTEQTEALVKVLATYINDMLAKHFGRKVVYPISDLNHGGEWHGVSNLCYCSNVRVFLSHNLNQIKEAIFNKQEIDISLIALSDFNTIYEYAIKQKYNDKSITWSWTQKEPVIWDLEMAINERLESTKNKSLSKVKKSEKAN